MPDVLPKFLGHAENVVVVASGYFHVTGLVYAFTAISMVLFSDCQGWGRATVSLLTSLLRRVSVILAATTLAVIFALRPPGAVRKAVSG